MSASACDQLIYKLDVALRRGATQDAVGQAIVCGIEESRLSAWKECDWSQSTLSYSYFVRSWFFALVAS